MTLREDSTTTYSSMCTKTHCNQEQLSYLLFLLPLFAFFLPLFAFSPSPPPLLLSGKLMYIGHERRPEKSYLDQCTQSVCLCVVCMCIYIGQMSS